ncbi:MAG: 5'-nucleotidase C-terminal domain-containing protein [Flavobacteriia bacterium]|nr:5'-nucleotidase C-terminal domain-containing protein [Flavobacteriia bacterium]
MTDRRKFIKKLGYTGIGLSLFTPFGLNAKNTENKSANTILSECTKKSKKIISILQTTDVHCQIHPHDELFWENEQAVYRKTGGYSYLASYIKQFKSKNPNTFTIDTGDMFQGSELSVKTTGKAFVPLLNAINYDLYLPGNWEVIYGKKNMQTLLGSLNAPKICANMYHDLGKGEKGELIFQPYYIWNIEGIKIGFLGYTDHLVPVRQSPNYSKGIIYKKPEENLAHYVDVLKNQEQCAYIIIIAHLGLSQQIALANLPECEGVNYILGGDTHERVRKPIECKYAKVVEPGAFGSFIGKLDLEIENGKIIQDSYSLIEVDPSKINKDKEVEAILTQNEELFKAEINQIIGYSTLPLYRYFVIENTIDTLILNGLHWKFPEIDIVLSNGFRFCPPRTTPDNTGNIPITNGFIFDMLPVDSPIRTAKATGSQIREWLEKELNNVFAKEASKRLGGWVVKFKGMEITFNAYGENGKRIQTIQIKGKALEKNQLYSILACERDGDPEDMLCRMTKVIEAKNTDFTLHKAMIEYISKNSPLTPKPESSAKVLDASQLLLTQVSGVNYEFK